MKTKKVLLTAMIPLFMMGANPIYAGGHESHGGSVLIRDNEVIIADPFVQKTNPPSDGESMTFSDELKSYLLHVKQLLENYDISGENPFGLNNNVDFWRHKVFGSDIQYRYSEELPCEDPFSVVPGTDGELVQFACTINRITWFKKSIFEQLSLKDQVLAIIHERLHAFTFEGHNLISDFISIIRTMLTIQNEQFHGERRRLTEDEFNQILRIRKVAHQLGFKPTGENPSTLDITSVGGGVVNHSVVPWSVFIGIGSLVENSTLSGNLEIMYSMIQRSNISGGKIINSYINNSSNLNNCRIENSRLINTNLVAQNSSILNSEFLRSTDDWLLEQLTNTLLGEDYRFGSFILDDDVILNHVQFRCAKSNPYGHDIQSCADLKIHIKQNVQLANLSMGFYPSNFFFSAPSLIFSEGSTINGATVPNLIIKVSGENKISSFSELLKLRKK